MTASALRAGYGFAGASVALVTTAQLAMKWGMSRLPGLDALDADSAVWAVASAPLVAVAGGVLCYLLSLLCWLRALADLPLNRAYPLLSLSYALVFVASVLLPGFRERCTPTQVLGLVLVSLGVWLVASGPADRNPAG